MAAPAAAQVQAPAGYTLTQLPPLPAGFDLEPLRIDAIRTTPYGEGVMVSRVEVVGMVYRSTDTGWDVFTTLNQPGGGIVLPDLAFDSSGSVGAFLFVTVGDALEQSGLFRVSPNGNSPVRDLPMDPDMSGPFLTAFPTAGAGFNDGAWLFSQAENTTLDTWIFASPGGPLQPFGAANTGVPGVNNFTLDAVDFDRSGLFGGGFVFATGDPAGGPHQGSSLQVLLPNFTVSTIIPPTPTDPLEVRDLVVVSEGSLGGRVYLSDAATNQVIAVDPGGATTTFMSGFRSVGSLAASEDGNTLWVVDQGTVDEPGPIVHQLSAPGCEADLSEPFGVLDFSDVIAFISAFGAGCP